MASLELPEELVQRIKDIAEREDRQPADVLDDLTRFYTPRQPLPPLPDDPRLKIPTVEEITQKLYKRARDYWREHGDERANMTDTELDEHFWLFDQDGVPRLKSEQGEIEIDQDRDPLLRMARKAQKEGLASGRSDISENADELLGNIIAKRMKQRQQEEQDA